MVSQRVEQQVRKWRDELIDLTRKNRLLNIRVPRRTDNRPDPVVSEPPIETEPLTAPDSDATIDDEVADVGSAEKPKKKMSAQTAFIEILEPDISTIINGLQRAPGWRFHYPPLTDVENDDEELLAALEGEDTEFEDELEADELLTPFATAKETQTAVRRIEARVRKRLIELGMPSLFLAVGLLRWPGRKAEDIQLATPDKKRETWTSPLILIPVTLTRASQREPFRLTIDDADTMINPALQVCFAESFGEQPADFEVGDSLADSVEVALMEIEDLVKRSVQPEERTHWEFSRQVVLADFTSYKEAMYRDLEENAEQIHAHPILQAFIEPGAEALDLEFDLIPEGELDQLPYGERALTILDADSSQMQCIQAARNGKSFVIQGPPGTGKSQTIANIISELMSEGKTVLFVSEKIAALEVVKNRLTERGLGDLVLELHSQKSSRKAVLEKLGEAILMDLYPPADSNRDLINELTNARQKLSAYAQSINEPLEPLGKSVQQLIGEISLVGDAPVLPLPNTALRSLSGADLIAVRNAANEFAAAYAPIIDLGEFPWVEATDAKSVIRNQSEIEVQLATAISSLDALLGALDTFEVPPGLGTPTSFADVDLVITLGRGIAGEHAIPISWLTGDQTNDAERIIAELIELYDKHTKLRRQLDADCPGWERLPQDLDDRLRNAIQGMEQLSPRLRAEDFSDRAALGRAAAAVEGAAPNTARLRKEMSTIAELLGVDHDADGATLLDARALVEIGSASERPELPEAAWLSDAGLTRAEAAVRELEPLAAHFNAERTKRDSLFKPSIGDLDIGLLCRDGRPELPLLSVWTATGRRNRAVLARHTVGGKVTKAVKQGLLSVSETQAAAQRLRDAEVLRSDDLGAHYYRSSDTDFAALHRAITNAADILRLVGHNANLEVVAGALSRGSAKLAAISQHTQRISSLSEDLRAQLRDCLPSQAPALLSDHVKRIELWLHDAHPALRTFEAALSEVDAAEVRGDLRNLIQVAGDARKYNELTALLEGRTSDAHGILGDQFHGVDTNWARCREELAWAAACRSLYGGPLAPSIAEAVLQWSADPEKLAAMSANASRALAPITRLFDHDSDTAAALNGSFEAQRSMVTHLQETLDALAYWDECEIQRETLELAGLGNTLSAAIDRKVEPSQIPAALTKALLKQIVSDATQEFSESLRPLTSQGRDQLVERFRESDRRINNWAVNRTIERVATLARNADPRAKKRLERECSKQRNHAPTKVLLSEVHTAVLPRLPCFMMSPLAVSTYLPADLKFDAVIFDESSQVKPCDAVNAIYRGQQLILAGDPKQLPPSNYFESTNAEEEFATDEALEVYESILELGNTGALRPISLRWHYRSRHENLITFSNQKYYKGDLITFPSPGSSDGNLGVFWHYCENGIYDRGGTKVNEVEAQYVAQLIIKNLKEYPKNSLGVVAMSEAQEERIRISLEHAAREYPELETRLFSQDRLDGVFIKNLESVQGDERDTIIMSVGYGRDAAGRMTLNFGPLNKPGGERRLNVAITRARKRFELVASIRADEINLGTSQSVGPRHLKQYLEYAEKGPEALLPIPSNTGLGPDSPFEESVLEVIQSWGYQVSPQVGHLGYRIDIGVRDQNDSERFALGVECDGAAYHSSQVARDRDRLRQEVLENLGWTLHRIWSTAWFQNQADEEARLKRAIEQAMSRH